MVIADLFIILELTIDFILLYGLNANLTKFRSACDPAFSCKNLPQDRVCGALAVTY